MMTGIKVDFSGFLEGMPLCVLKKRKRMVMMKLVLMALSTWCILGGPLWGLYEKPLTPKGFYTGVAGGMSGLMAKHTMMVNGGQETFCHHELRKSALVQAVVGYQDGWRANVLGVELGWNVYPSSHRISQKTEDGAMTVVCNLKQRQHVSLEGRWGYVLPWGNPFVKAGVSWVHLQQKIQIFHVGLLDRGLDEKHCVGFAGGIGLEKNWKTLGVRATYSASVYPGFSSRAKSSVGVFDFQSSLSPMVHHAFTLGVVIYSNITLSAKHTT